MTAVIRLGRADVGMVILGLHPMLVGAAGSASNEPSVIAGKIRRLWDLALRIRERKGGLLRVDAVDLLILARAARAGLRYLRRFGKQRYGDDRSTKARLIQLKRRKRQLLAKLEMNRKRLHRRLARKGAGWREDAYQGFERSTVPVGALGVKSDHITPVGETADLSLLSNLEGRTCSLR